jgi:hypothetical protein
MAKNMPQRLPLRQPNLPLTTPAMAVPLVDPSQANRFLRRRPKQHPILDIHHGHFFHEREGLPRELSVDFVAQQVVV